MEANQLADSKLIRLVFDNLKEEVHFWKVIRDANNQIETWRLIYVNPPTLKTWGFQSIDEIENKTSDEIFGDGATKHYFPVINKIMEEQKPYTFRDFFPNVKRYFQFTSIPLEDYFITIGKDVTETGWDMDEIIEENISLASDNETLQQQLRYTNEFQRREIKDHKAMLVSSQKMTENLNNLTLELKNENLESFSNYKKIVDLVLKQSELVQQNATILKELHKAREENQRLRKMLNNFPNTF